MNRKLIIILLAALITTGTCWAQMGNTAALPPPRRELYILQPTISRGPSFRESKPTTRPPSSSEHLTPRKSRSLSPEPHKI